MGTKFILCFATAVTATVAVLFFFLFKTPEMPGSRVDSTAIERASSPDSPVKSEIFLYFSDKKKNLLTAEPRVFIGSEDPIKLGRTLIEALIQGPRNELLRTIPNETSLRALYIKDKTAYADFSTEIIDGHPGGSLSEYMTIYSIVNSLIVNIPEIEWVKILIGGEEVDTLAGHISILSPLKADMLLVR